jgi:hypothetical protein
VVAVIDPAAHSKQVRALATKLPAPQGVHEDEPGAAETWPTEQAEQAVALVTECFPAGQSMQSVGEARYLPAAQAMMVGLAVGHAVGKTEGKGEGRRVGTLVGSAVGSFDWFAVGMAVGSFLGEAVGNTEGGILGLVVGTRVGATDGTAVGRELG